MRELTGSELMIISGGIDDGMLIVGTATLLLGVVFYFGGPVPVFLVAGAAAVLTVRELG